MPGRFRGVARADRRRASALAEAGEAAPADIAGRFVRARATTVAPPLDTLAALGHATRLSDGRFAA